MPGEEFVGYQLTDAVRTILENDLHAQQLFAHDAHAVDNARPGGVEPGVFDERLMAALLRTPTLTRDEVIHTCQAARDRAGVDPIRYNEQHWEDTYSSVLFSMQTAHEPKGERALFLRKCLLDAWASPQGITAMDFQESSERSPQWKSGIEAIDEDMRLYGMAVVSGPEGVGKSRFINQSAMLAAEERDDDEYGGWTVIYLEAEDAANVSSRRTQAYWNLPWDTIRKKLKKFHRFWIPNHGVTAEDLRDWVVGCIDDDAEKVLIVLNSLHTIVDKLDNANARGEGYFGLMKQFLMWLQDARVSSNGLVASLIASEMNKEGQPKGGKVGYTLEAGVRITEVKGTGHTTIAIHKSRETKKPVAHDYIVIRERFIRADEGPLPEEESDGAVSTDGDSADAAEENIPLFGDRDGWT